MCTHTHAHRPHLDLLLQEVDFVLLLQKLLLLPGNLRKGHTDTLLECICSTCAHVCFCFSVCVCAPGLWEMRHICRSLRHDRGSMPRYEILKSTSHLDSAHSQIDNSVTPTHLLTWTQTLLNVSQLTISFLYNLLVLINLGTFSNFYTSIYSLLLLLERSFYCFYLLHSLSLSLSFCIKATTLSL